MRKLIYLNDIYSDEFCFIDLVKDIEDGCGFKDGKIEWEWEGLVAVIENDTQLLNMWDHIENNSEVFKLYYS